MRIVQISDPHFGALREGVPEKAAEMIRGLNPSLVLLTGDITQRARRRQFEDAREFLEKLRIPFIAVPGNHDIPLFNLWARFWNPHGGYRKHFRGTLESRFRKDGVEIIAVNSAQWWHHINGEVDLGWLEERLRTYADDSRLRLLAFHHPLDFVLESDVKNLIQGSEKIASLCSQYKVDLVLGGHIHNPSVRLASERYPQVKRNFIIAVAGTSLSHRVRAEASNSFYSFDWEPNGSLLKVTEFRYSAQGDFEFFKASSFSRKDAGWA